MKIWRSSSHVSAPLNGEIIQYFTAVLVPMIDNLSLVVVDKDCE